MIIENGIHDEKAFRELDRSVLFVSIHGFSIISLDILELNFVVEISCERDERVLEFANLLWLYSLNQFWYIIMYTILNR